MPDKQTSGPHKPGDVGPFRVKSRSTGDEFTVAVLWSDDQEVIDKPALGPDGRHAPAKPNLSVRKVAEASTKESK